MKAQDVKISYAQNREDIILEALVGGALKGFYVDVGANDPNHDSVTKRFYLKGWRGINLEPNKLLWERLTFDRPRDINLRLGAGERNEKLAFREYSDSNGLSTFSHAMKEENERVKVGAFKDYDIEVRTLRDIFKEYSVADIDFLKIDVEGFEWEVIQGNDWDAYRPKVLCIEANHLTRLQKWHNFFDEIGYEFVFFDGINEYYRDKNRGPWSEFSYPKAVLAIPVITHEQHLQQSLLKTEISGLNRELNLIRIHVRHLWKDAEMRHRQIHTLDHEIKEMRRVRRAVKTLMKAINNAVVQRIESMNSTPVVNVSLPPESVVAIDEADTAMSLLKKIQVFDVANNYRRTIVYRHPNKLAYRAVKGGYGMIKQLGKISIVGARKARKAIGK
jgi:FkbM family methyltransferase